MNWVRRQPSTLPCFCVLTTHGHSRPGPSVRPLPPSSRSQTPLYCTSTRSRARTQNVTGHPICPIHTIQSYPNSVRALHPPANHHSRLYPPSTPNTSLPSWTALSASTLPKSTSSTNSFSTSILTTHLATQEHGVSPLLVTPKRHSIPRPPFCSRSQRHPGLCTKLRLAIGVANCSVSEGINEDERINEANDGAAL